MSKKASILERNVFLILFVKEVDFLNYQYFQSYLKIDLVIFALNL